jgi:hypothetical protein
MPDPLIEWLLANATEMERRSKRNERIAKVITLALMIVAALCLIYLWVT